MLILVLTLIALGGLFLTAIGLPGTWIFLAVASASALFDPASPVAWWSIVVGVLLGLIAEGIEWVTASRYARKYGGSPRAAFGALLGGIGGAIVGFPVPLFGPLVGALLGTFIGALVAEYSVSGLSGGAERVAWGAMIGRIVATVAKLGLGIVIAVLVLVAAGLAS
jgi:uncharacterized protein YqgC (DUF456 family)